MKDKVKKLFGTPKDGPTIRVSRDYNEWSWKFYNPMTGEEIELNPHLKGEKGIKFELKIHPISLNQAFQGRRFKTKKAKNYEEELTILLSPFKDRMVLGKLEIHYKFFLKYHATTDCDNLVKLLQDILVKQGLMEDDRKIYKYIIEKFPAKKVGETQEDRVEIEIKPYV